MAEKTVGAPKVEGGIPVGINLETFRFMLDGKVVMAANLPAGVVLLDVPGSTQKMFEFTTDPAKRYQEETIVATATGTVTYYQAPKTGISGLSPNLPRNEFTGQYDAFNLYELPA